MTRFATVVVNLKPSETCACLRLAGYLRSIMVITDDSPCAVRYRVLRRKDFHTAQ